MSLTLTLPVRTPGPNGEQAPARQTPAGAKKTSGKGSKAIMYDTTTKEYKQGQKKHLTDIHKIICQRDTDGWFMVPVTDDIAPQYSLRIKNPMDLGTIRKMIAEDATYTFEAYITHFELVCDNCMEYNGPNNIFFTKAEKLKKWGAKKINTASKKFVTWAKKNVPKLGQSPGAATKGKQAQNPNKRKNTNASQAGPRFNKRQRRVKDTDAAKAGRSTPNMQKTPANFKPLSIPMTIGPGGHSEAKKRTPEAFMSNMQLLRIARVNADTAREKLNELSTLGQMCVASVPAPGKFSATPLHFTTRKPEMAPVPPPRTFALPDAQPLGEIKLEFRLPMTKQGTGVASCCVENKFLDKESDLTYDKDYGDASVKAYCDSMRKFAEATGSDLHKELVEERIRHITFGAMTDNPGVAEDETTSALAKWDAEQEKRQPEPNQAAERTLNVNAAFLLELNAKLKMRLPPHPRSNPTEDEKEFAEGVVASIKHLAKVQQKQQQLDDLKTSVSTSSAMSATPGLATGTAATAGAHDGGGGGGAEAGSATAAQAGTGTPASDDASGATATPGQSASGSSTQAAPADTTAPPASADGALAAATTPTITVSAAVSTAATAAASSNTPAASADADAAAALANGTDTITAAATTAAATAVEATAAVPVPDPTAATAPGASTSTASPPASVSTGQPTIDSAADLGAGSAADALEAGPIDASAGIDAKESAADGGSDKVLGAKDADGDQDGAGPAQPPFSADRGQQASESTDGAPKVDTTHGEDSNKEPAEANAETSDSADTKMEVDDVAAAKSGDDAAMDVDTT